MYCFLAPLSTKSSNCEIGGKSQHIIYTITIFSQVILCTHCCSILSFCIVVSHLISFSTQHGGTPLYVACQNGHKQTVDVLLENGANVNLTTTVS